jgi:hypothetical protein
LYVRARVISCFRHIVHVNACLRLFKDAFSHLTCVLLAGNPFIGTRYFALNNLDASQYHLWFFQWTVRLV